MSRRFQKYPSSICQSTVIELCHDLKKKYVFTYFYTYLFPSFNSYFMMSLVASSDLLGFPPTGPMTRAPPNASPRHSAAARRRATCAEAQIAQLQLGDFKHSPRQTNMLVDMEDRVKMRSGEDDTMDP